jgi:hypothetical protein
MMIRNLKKVKKDLNEKNYTICCPCRHAGFPGRAVASKENTA